jgi:hypothetical protein
MANVKISMRNRHSHAVFAFNIRMGLVPVIIVNNVSVML